MDAPRTPTRSADPSTPPKARSAPGKQPAAQGRLDWRELLQWLEADGLIDPAAGRYGWERCAHASGKLHALQRVALAGLKRLSNGRTLDMNVLTE